MPRPAVMLFLVLLTTVQLVLADYEIALYVSRYRNPTSTKIDGSCCDEYSSKDCNSGWNRCDNLFIYCLRTVKDTSLNSSNCPLGRVHSTMITYDHDDMIFKYGEGALSGLPNPLSVGGSDGAWRGAQLLVAVLDYDPPSFQLVDKFIINITGPAGQNYTSVQTHTSVNNIAEIDLSFAVVCTNDHYGSDCGTFCVEKNDNGGHYSCDIEGNRVCKDGYQNPLTNCTQCVPLDGCSPIGGYCTQPGTCLCHEGFYDAKCTKRNRTIPDSNESGDSSAAISGGIVGGLLVVVVVVLVTTVFFLLMKYGCAAQSGKGFNAPLATRATNPVTSQGGNRLKSTAEPIPFFVSGPGDNPVYGLQGNVCQSTKTTSTLSSAVVEFDNPIYGTQWDCVAPNGHIYATLESSVHEVIYAVPDNLPPLLTTTVTAKK